MPERIAVQLRAEMQQLRRDMKRGMSGIRSDMERIEGQSKKINRNTQSWASSILTSAKHLASAYITFQGISTIQDAISQYTEAWVRSMEEAGRLGSEMAENFSQVQLQTVRMGDNWERIRKEAERTMQAFGTPPGSGWKAFETIRSVLSGQQWSPEERRGTLRAVSMHGAMTTIPEETLASVNARLRNMFDQYSGMQMQAMLERVIARTKLGGEKLQQFTNYLTRAGAAGRSWNRGLPSMLALGAGMSGIVANPGRALKHTQMLIREMMENKALQPKGEGPYPLLQSLKEQWGQAETMRELRNIVQNTDMSQRVLEDIKPLLEALPEIKRIREQIRSATPQQMKTAFGDVMEDPTKKLGFINNKLDTLIDIQGGQMTQQQRIQATRKMMKALQRRGVEAGFMAPGRGEWAQWMQMTQWKYGMKTDPAQMLARYIEWAGSNRRERKQLMQWAKQAGNIPGIPEGFRPAERLALTEEEGTAPMDVRARPLWLQRRRQRRRALGRSINRLPRAMMYQQAGFYPREFGEEREGEMAAQMAENMQQVERNTRRAAENSQRRSHSSDRAGAQP